MSLVSVLSVAELKLFDIQETLHRYIIGFLDEFCFSCDHNVRDFHIATKSVRHQRSFLYYNRLIGEITNMETIPLAFIGD
jgi:hypothetical protein